MNPLSAGYDRLALEVWKWKNNGRILLTSSIFFVEKVRQN